MNTKQVIEKRFDELPLDVRAALTSPEYPKNIAEVAHLYSLDEIATRNLENETTLVLLGLTQGEQFAQNVSRASNITREKSLAICREINEQIFRPIRDGLKIIHGVPTIQNSAVIASKTVAPPSNLPTLQEHREVGEPQKTQMLTRRSTEGFVPLQKKPADSTIMPSMQDGERKAPLPENPFRTMKQDALKAMAENPVHPASFAHATDETMTDKAAMLKKIETNGPIPRMPGGSILESKLGGTTNIPREKIGPTKDGDPYREEI